MSIQTESKFDDTAMWDAFHKFHYLCDKHRFKKLFARADLFRMVADLPGDIVDAGAFKGVSTIHSSGSLTCIQIRSILEPNETRRKSCRSIFP